MSVQINVALDERGPAELRMRQLDRLGHALELDRYDPYLTACEDLAASGKRPAAARSQRSATSGETPAWRHPP